MVFIEREKEKEIKRERERQRDRETERQRDRETERQRDRETERQREREGESSTLAAQQGSDRATETHTHTHMSFIGVEGFLGGLTPPPPPLIRNRRLKAGLDSAGFSGKCFYY